jgi:hypothetical protein
MILNAGRSCDTPKFSLDAQIFSRRLHIRDSILQARPYDSRSQDLHIDQRHFPKLVWAGAVRYALAIYGVIYFLHGLTFSGVSNGVWTSGFQCRFIEPFYTIYLLVA